MIKKRKEEVGKFYLIIVVLIISLWGMFFLVKGISAMVSGSLGDYYLTIYDGSDNNTKRSGWDVVFYANYTYDVGTNISSGNCTIKFQDSSSDYGDLFNMTYNSTHGNFQYNRTFDFKGNYYFEINCSNISLSGLNLSEYFNITNSIPTITKEQGSDWIDFDDNSQNHDSWACTEDNLCIYNFSSNVSDLDANDVLSYTYDSANTTITNFTLNTSTGVLTINVTHSDNTGNGKRIQLEVEDNDINTLWQAGLLNIDVTDVNDAPVFVGLFNQSFNSTELFELIVNVTDEENNVPFNFSMNFTNCTAAEWSTRNCSNVTGRELFNTSQYSFNQTSGVLNISFTPERNDVGSYIINFSVFDNSSLGNKTTSKIINFSVINVNSVPYFLYACDNERETIEDTEFTCWINVTDIDELNNLTLSLNYSWLTFNDSSSSIIVGVNMSTNYNASVIINITANDTMVGNWSVNLSVTDTGIPVKVNSTVFWFFINNTEDIVIFDEVSNQTVYENLTFYVNASDNDLLVPQASIKDEVLTFASNSSWVTISSYSSSENYTTAKINLDYNTAFNTYGEGNYTVSLNVSDTAGNYIERNFTAEIIGDTAPVWNETMENFFVFYEGNTAYFNFTQNVTDAEGDSINFSFINDTSFPSFSINSTTGVINFTFLDRDVGYHNVTINATDGKLNSLKSFNFTIYNVNDDPFIENPLTVVNGSVDSNSNINVSEDNYTTITLWIQDDDFKILSNQGSFYNEILNVNLTIVGSNTTLFNFTRDVSFPTTGSNQSKYEVNLTPGKSDIGTYNITINVTDKSNVSVVLQFNLTVLGVQHNPVLMNVSNQTSTINRSFYYRINATDLEDGDSTTDGNYNLTFTYTILSGVDFFNATTFNSSTGIINITFNSTSGGRHHINVTVNDSSNRTDTGDFWINIYDISSVVSPSAGFIFNLTENVSLDLGFTLNHSLQDNLTFLFYVDDISYNGSDYSYGNLTLRQNQSYYGDGSNLSWTFTPNFTEETYGKLINLSLVVYPSSVDLLNAIDLNTTTKFSFNISHTNAPVVFSGYIGDVSSTYDSDILIDLSSYFTDVDYDDSYYNHTINFTSASNATPSYITISFLEFNVTFSSVIAVTELVNISASDFNESEVRLTNATSNNFQVTFTVPPVVTAPSSGGGSSLVPYAFKIISVGEISAFPYQKIEVPISLVNRGKKAFTDISLSSSAFKDGNVFNQLDTSFQDDSFKILNVGQTINTTMTLFFKTDEPGDYEILINASSKTPKYSDWAKIYVKLEEVNKSQIKKLLLFTEEYLVQNPQCVELIEVLNEAKKMYEDGKFQDVRSKLEEVVSLCKEFISQVSLERSADLGSEKGFNQYLLLATLGSFVCGVFYYYFQRRRFKRSLKLYKSE